MKTRQSAAAEIGTVAATLRDAVGASGRVDCMTAFAPLYQGIMPFVHDPDTEITQDMANQIGADLLTMKATFQEAGATDLLELEVPLHDRLSVTLARYAPDVDWYEAAQIPYAEQTSGSKHKPS